MDDFQDFRIHNFKLLVLNIEIIFYWLQIQKVVKTNSK